MSPKELLTMKNFKININNEKDKDIQRLSGILSNSFYREESREFPERFLSNKKSWYLLNHV